MNEFFKIPVLGYSFYGLFVDNPKISDSPSLLVVAILIMNLILTLAGSCTCTSTPQNLPQTAFLMNPNVTEAIKWSPM